MQRAQQWPSSGSTHNNPFVTLLMIPLVRINLRYAVDPSRNKQSQTMTTPRFVNEVRRTRLLPGAMTTGAPPRDTATPATRAPAQAAGTPLRACRYLVVMGYNVGCLLIYKRPRVQRVRLRHYKYPTHTTTPSPSVTQLVQNIRHKHNKLHLGEYSPPP